jgi:ParB-like chromosome segregation protein Spo0J
MKKLIPLARLKFDENVYPRRNIDRVNVTRMVETLSAGGILPPIIVCARTKRVVDGFHRARAYRRFHGKDAKIPSVLKHYKSDVDFLADAIESQPKGCALGRDDQVHCAHLAEEVGMPIVRLAQALSTPVKKLEKLIEERTARTGKSGGEKLVLKPGASHMHGQKLTEAQAEVNRKLSGLDQSYMVRVLTDLLREGMVDWADEKLRVLLGGLKVELEKYMAARRKKSS